MTEPRGEFRIEDYVIGRMLGRGGMGTVFEGVHARIGRRAAIKLLDPDQSQDGRIVARFLNEARAANKIDHPSIVQIYQFGQLPGGPAYIIMEYLEGELLSARVRRCGPMGAAAVSIARQIAAGLSVAHRSCVIHRDLKPNNIMLIADPESRAGERVKVLDFGVAKLTEGGTATETGIHLGTPSFMAPEQFGGPQPVSDRADVYALGLLLYTMLSGAHPFTGAPRAEIMDLQRRAAPPPLAERVPQVSTGLAALVHRMLEKAPERRPSMDEVARALAALEAGGALEDPLDAETPRTTTPRRRTGPLWLVSGAALLLGLLALFYVGQRAPASAGGPATGAAAHRAPAPAAPVSAPTGAEAPVSPPSAPAAPLLMKAPPPGRARAGRAGARAPKAAAPPERPRSPSKYRADEDIPFMP